MSRATWSRGLPLGLLAGVVWLALVLARGEAGPYPTVVVGIDMDGLSENGVGSLGAIQNCTEAAPGETVTIDVYVDGVPSGKDLSGFNYLIGFEPDALAIGSATHEDEGINLLASAPGSVVIASSSSASNGSHIIAYDAGPAEQGPLRGVLGRYTFQVGMDAAGAYELTLDQVGLFDSAGIEIAQTGAPVGGQLAISPNTCAGAPEPEPPPPAPPPTPLPGGEETSGPSPDADSSTPAGSGPDIGATNQGAVGERFLYPPLGFRTTITAFFDHTGPQQGPDGWMQVYTGDGGSDERPCDSDPRAYESEELGICLHYDGHAAYDFDLRDGVSTAIRAAADGCAVKVGWEGAFGFKVVLSHDNGYRTLYGHLDDGEPHISNGECVTAGERIGYGGSTGCQCGEHLHFAVLSPNGTPTDPYGWWGSEPDPSGPASKWLWSVEQPATNRLPVPAPEDAPGPLRRMGYCADQATSERLPAVLTIGSMFPCQA